MSIFWLTFVDFIRIAGSITGKITSTEGFTNEVIHPLTYYESDGILYLYRAFGNVVYGTKVPMTLIEQEVGGFEAFHTEHLKTAINLVQNY